MNNDTDADGALRWRHGTSGFKPRAFDTMFSSGFGFDAVPKAFVSMSHLPALESADEVPDEVPDEVIDRARYSL
jgi:hypothetical protein